MEMKRISAGKLRAIGYEPRERRLRVELDNGQLIDYTGVGEEVWRRLSNSGAAWSYYRDNIEEEYTGKAVSAGDGVKRANPLDELFRK
ncbi:KTSC domain-containing protein [Aromatoleum evansii]|uniref:KTSC domain-containing protein n=1 Tax=Aromatoleum evansii TaxID=59406 RepID=A0ABZ1ALX7_AROEV|nr:KTSC domain-containing protein [Aromatoleum evansii]NMG27583.1 KTSC domain-containing protein [Aromatoleum evansii]WRL46284.1 KTSC domain-containing protein [Aromatoleum evansii]